MTCIAAVVHGDRVTMGGDSAGTGWHNQGRYKHGKVFEVRDASLNDFGPKGHALLIGVSGSYRDMDLLRYMRLPPPEPVDVHRWMVTAFVPAIQKKREDAGMSKDKWDSAVLVGTVDARLLIVHMNLCVLEPMDDFAAVGSGDDLALGSLRSSVGLAPRERVEKALEAASQNNSTVRPPWTIMEL